MSVFLPLLLFLGICLILVWLLRRQQGSRAQDYLVSTHYTPPEVIRNSTIAYALRLAAFGPFFAFGARGDFWPVIIGAASFGLGVYLLDVLRRPILAFLAGALSGDRSITVHAFIARHYGDDPRLRRFAAALTLFALAALVAGEAFAVAGFLKVVFGNEAAARWLTLGALGLAALYALPAGHSGTMHSAQLQLGVIFLGLFGATALLLYLHVSALTPIPPHVTFAILLVAACCLGMLVYRRSRYIDTGSLDPRSRSAKWLSKFEKVLNPVISVFVVLVIVLASMEFSAAGFSVVAFSGVDTLRDGTNMPLLGLIALGLLPLFYPLADVTHWQRLAAAEKNRDAYQGDTARWLKALRRFLRMYSIESPLLLLFVASFGAIAAGAMAVPGGTDVTQALIQALASGDNVVAMTAFSLLLIAVAAMALSTMSSGLSAGLCTIHYDILPAKAGMRPAIVTGGAFLLVIVAAFLLADAALPMGFTSSSFLALLFALGCPPLSFAPLILGPILTSRSVSPTWALRILGSGAASTAIGLTAFSVTGNDAWLWATVPVCLGAGILLFAAGRWSSR